MGEGDEGAGLLDSRDGRDAGDGEDVAFLECVLADEAQWRVVREGDVADGEGTSVGRRFLGYGYLVDGRVWGEVREVRSAWRSLGLGLGWCCRC